MAAPNLWQWTYQGLVMGDGTDYEVTLADGIDGMPEIPQSDLKVDRDQGDYAGLYTAKGRLVTLDVEVHAGTDAQFRTDIDALGAATAPIGLVEQPLAFLLPGVTQLGRQVNVRPLTRAVPIDVDYTHRIAHYVLTFYATDPRIYDYSQQMQSTGLPAGNGGAAWPWVWPLSWGSASAGGTVTCTNSGTFESRPYFSITGPIQNLTVQNNTTGLAFTWNGTLGASDILVIDMLHKVVQVNGAGNARGQVTPASTWWTLVPGANVVQFSANTVLTGSIMTVTFSSAWI